MRGHQLDVTVSLSWGEPHRVALLLNAFFSEMTPNGRPPHHGSLTRGGRHAELGWLFLGYFGKESLASCLDLLLRQLLFSGCHGPFVTERIHELPESITPEHIRNRHRHRCTSRGGTMKGLIRVFEIEVERDRCASKRLWTANAFLRLFASHHDDRIPNLELRMQGALAVRSYKPRLLLGAKGALVKIDGLVHFPNHQLRCNAVVASRNRVDLRCHNGLFLVTDYHFGKPRPSITGRTSTSRCESICCGPSKLSRKTAFSPMGWRPIFSLLPAKSGSG